MRAFPGLWHVVFYEQAAFRRACRFPSNPRPGGAKTMTVTEQMTLVARNAREASRRLGSLSANVKNELLRRMAQGLLDAQEQLTGENEKDLMAARAAGLSTAMLDRLTLDSGRIRGMADGLREVAELPDPVGEVTGMRRRPNGLLVGRMRVPLGVIGIIYESRPNVTADAAGLCLKSGNAVILRGGKESLHSNLAIGGILQNQLERMGLPAACLQVIKTTDRDAMLELLKREDEIDLIIPRGGEGLIRFVSEHSRIPVIKHYKGVCHTFVDASADFAQAEKICVNAKVQRPGVCNAMETLLVHQDIAETFIPRIASVMRSHGVELRGCPVTKEFAPDIQAASEEDWYAEYLDLSLAVRVVENLEEAIDHIRTYGSLHTEVIVTRDYENSQRFLNEVNSSVVMVNASSRFSDG